MSKLINFIFILPIKMYQRLLSPLIGPSCRFNPTCSHYAIQAITKYGALKGLYLALKRITRCHPWGESGNDPVP
jgi:putative membrane protein insertion efficiency factor